MGEPLVVGVREFKARLGTYLGWVREGRILTITDRGRPVAEVTPIEFDGRSVEARLARLRRQGVVTGQAKPVPPIASPIIGRGRSFSEAVSEDREDRVLSASGSPSGQRLP